ncbi:hypothetical protein BGW36DRAFT_433072 [Talaromyces proteolyticus]|uniref:NAD-dependent epimerase/dehydratase domain-containing protein n=1 Tax=Talaromyces proteolyticus TaxID=1131652 RepID=A0AAD4KF23_9EURO|nr:uncharacterized protein BGW36DRAFT_433072 [Talaromyces proteolyticus]KAH8690119.1 hypothetical protein BGW36DRAFT_433072 [Talaromyces proteolyticus]
MVQNILITGAAGYIGGSVLSDLLATSSSALKGVRLYAAVRTQEQVQALSKLGVNVIQMDISDAETATEAVLKNEIDMVVHTASSILADIPILLIQALGQRRQVSGKQTYFIHSSVITIYSEEAGWPAGEVKDTDPLFQKEKELASQHPVVKTNIAVVEEALKHDVKCVNIAVPTVYGTGTGQWRKLSVSIPAYIRVSIEHKIVYKFDKDGSPPAVHISDLAELYVILVEKILQEEDIPMTETGYYFAMAHRAPWWQIMDGIANALYARGLVPEPKVHIWPSDEMAAEYLGFPAAYIRAMGTASGNATPVNAYRLGWQPKWTQEKFLESIDDEVQAVLDFDIGNTNIFKVLHPSEN